MSNNDDKRVLRYLQGQMLPDEKISFEEEYLDDPDLLDRVEVFQTVKDHAAAFVTLELLPERPNRWGWVMPSLAGAAASLAIAVLIWKSIPGSAGTTLVYDLGVYRSAEPMSGECEGTLNQVFLSADFQQLVLRAYGGTTDHVDVVLLGDVSTAYSQTALPLDPDGYVSYAVSANSLKAGCYSLAVTSGNETQTYEFHLSMGN